MTKRNGETNINNDKRLSSMSKDIMFEIFLQLPIRDLVQLKLVYNVRASVSCEGKLHWLMTKKRDIEEKVKLLTLDVATEKFDEMECCLPFDRNNNPLKFSGSNGKFYHMRVTSWNDFELWDLRDLNNHQPTWFKHQLWINDPTLSIPPLVGWFDFICESQDGGKFIFMRKDRRGFLVYEITTQKFTRLALDEGATVNIDKSTLVHINSLIS
ncbi:hypothetical protein SAY87_006869 [Trapa incisa]|uniref:F-box associated beta-propeller type 1 domain-containing protein n=1 Tax=Trapa incisa TaxID=236973 RepID=A0AAN7K1V7_9MYRT|nr:hypothetical protein SAY87_006869 [Trapa incisa]